MHELLFHRQRALEDYDLKALCRPARARRRTLRHDRRSPEVIGRIRRDIESGLATGEVRGTPTLFIDGALYLGDYDVATLTEALSG